MAPGEQPTEPPVERLVLDLGGVVLTSAMPRIVAELAERSGRGEQSLWRYFNDRLFRPFWGGTMNVEAFWAEFTAHAGVPGVEGRWQRDLVRSMLALRIPAARVRRWADRVPVGVLSNQRAEWVRPVLAREGLLEVLDPVLISSETGLLKPSREAFAQLTALGTPPGRILYVDDRPQAVRAACGMGIAAIQADPGGGWADRVDARLGCAA
jgi:putative hydrolase of the HAD superfamily